MATQTASPSNIATIEVERVEKSKLHNELHRSSKGEDIHSQFFYVCKKSTFCAFSLVSLENSSRVLPENSQKDKNEEIVGHSFRLDPNFHYMFYSYLSLTLPAVSVKSEHKIGRAHV